MASAHGTPRWQRFESAADDLFALSLSWLVAFLLLGPAPVSFLLASFAGAILLPHPDVALSGRSLWPRQVGRRALIALVSVGVAAWLGGSLSAALWIGGLWTVASPLSLLRIFGIPGSAGGPASPASSNVWLPDAIIALAAVALTSRFWFQPISPSIQLALVLGWSVSAEFAQKYFHPQYRTAFAVRIGVFLCAFAALGWPVHPGDFAAAGLVLTAILLLPDVVATFLIPPQVAKQPARFWSAILLGAVWFLYQSIAHPTCQGGGDAEWYGMLSADMLAQTRAGFFPVFCGQSVYQVNGSIYPLHVAPGFQYGCALLDLATFHTLGAFAVQNLFLWLCAAVSALSAFVGFAWLTPRAGAWLAAFAAFLFIACPGVMSVLYTADLFMSWTTVPFVIIAFTSTALSFTRPTPRVHLTLGVALGLTWWGHTPIALWTTLFVAIVQLVRVGFLHKTAGWQGLLWTAAAFSLVAAFPLVSALAFPPEAGANVSGFQAATPGNIYALLRESFPFTWLPVDATRRTLGAFQLGYAVWSVFFIALVQAFRTPQLAVRTLLLLAAFSFLLLTPIPSFNQQLWALIPGTIRDTTGNWVMNRLYLITAAMILTAGCCAASRIDPRRLLKPVALGLVIAAVAWTSYQARSFGSISDQLQRPPDSADDALRPENVKITRFAYLVFTRIPDYFTDGVIDPELEHRFYREDGTQAWSNTSLVLAAASSHDPRAPVTALGHFSHRPDQPAVWELPAAVTLQPRRNYLLKFDFAGRSFAGILQISGPGFLREYQLPSYGGSRSFGCGADAARTIPLWSTRPTGTQVTVRFIANAGSSAEGADAIAADLIEYDRSILQARVESWVPYRVQLTTNEPGWLETPRSYQTFWRATGLADRAKRTPEGLVALRSSGKSGVYGLLPSVPLLFRSVFWLSLLSVTVGCPYVVALRPRPAEAPISTIS